MKNLLVCLGLLSAAAGFLVAAEPLAKPAAQPRLGMNLNGPADWNTELPFVDVFRFSRAWISQRKGQPWGKGPALALDAQGWVTQLEPDCSAETPLCTIDKGHFPSGEYTVLYEGEGRLEASNASVISRAPGRVALKVEAARGGFFLRIAETNPKNYLRQIRVIMPGFVDQYRTQPFHPLFLKRWQGMGCLRFMDWMLTNGSKTQKWPERPTLADATWTRSGVPIEVMVDLCNRLNCDAWFCLPHQADDEYVREFARLVKQQLHPGAQIYLEYSNEVWNGMFKQSQWAGEAGRKLGFAEKSWEAAWRYTAYRSVQIFKIWEEVFGGRQRLVRVLPSQAANPYVSERVVEWQEAYRQADALAIAPYLTCNVAKNGKGNSEAIVEKWTVEQALDYLQTNALPEARRWMQGNKKVADKYGLKLVCYEAGQHMVGVQGVENNNPITQLLQAANRHPRLGEVYRQYYAAWTQEGGDLLCYFSSVGQWSKWGSWGIMEYYDDDPAQSPKFTATMNWAKAMGQKVNP